jgi:hypothetical protein
MQSIFTQKNTIPTKQDLKTALNKTVEMWDKLLIYALEIYPEAKLEWKFTSEKFGWSFRISDKKRVLIYLLPRENYFKVAFVFGQKAFNKIIESKIDSNIIASLKAAKVYKEGRGIRIDIKDNSLLKDIKILLLIKIEN